jgi:hypothetical protein
MIRGNKVTTSISESLGVTGFVDVSSYIEQINTNQISHKNLVLIYTILQNTNEHYMHNMNGVTSNVVYISPDGHHEGVYDKDGKLVQDGVNDPSYNFASYQTKPLEHFILNISPWIILGNSRADTTTCEARIFNFLCDFEGGIRRSLELSRNDQINNSIRFSSEQKKILAFLVHIINHSKDPLLFNLFDQNYPVTDAEMLDCLTQLREGFHSVYLTKN